MCTLIVARNVCTRNILFFITLHVFGTWNCQFWLFIPPLMYVFNVIENRWGRLSGQKCFFAQYWTERACLAHCAEFTYTLLIGFLWSSDRYFGKVNHKHIFTITSIICFSTSISYYTYCNLKIEKFIQIKNDYLLCLHLFYV